MKTPSYPSPPTWMASAACASTDPELFFPESGGGVNGASHTARQVCAGCPVRLDCLTYALDHPEPLLGVWGGTTEKQRRPLRNRRAAA